MKAGAGSQVNVAEHRKCQRQRGITKLWNGGDGAKDDRGKRRKEEEYRVTREVACPLVDEINFPSWICCFAIFKFLEMLCSSAQEISHKLFIMHYYALTITFYSVNTLQTFNLFADMVFRHSNLFCFTWEKV